MKVLVSGGAGFIGSHMVDRLVEEKHQVSVVDFLGETSIRYQNPETTFYEADIRNEKDLERIFDEEMPEIVIHMAAQSVVPPSIKNPSFDQSINVGGTLQILEQMRRVGSRKIIYSSTAAVYGDPISLPISEDHPIEPKSPYGLSKWIAEHYIALYHRMYGIDYSILRYANIYGPRQTADGEGGVVSIFVDKLKKNEAPTINGDGGHTRDFVFVKDVVEANLLAMDKGSKQVMNISTGQAISIAELLQTLNEVNGTNIQPIFAAEREGDIVHSTLNPTKAFEALGWKATTSLNEGLGKTLAK